MSPISVDGHDMADMTRESWVWDTDHKSSHVVLSPNHEAAYFHVDPMLESTGTAGKTLVCYHLYKYAFLLYFINLNRRK